MKLNVIRIDVYNCMRLKRLVMNSSSCFIIFIIMTAVLLCVRLTSISLYYNIIKAFG